MGRHRVSALERPSAPTMSGAVSSGAEKRLGDMYCDECRGWMPLQVECGEELDDGDEAVCARCFEPFKCGNCGFEVNAAGDCQRARASNPDDVTRCEEWTP